MPDGVIREVEVDVWPRARRWLRTRRTSHASICRCASILRRHCHQLTPLHYRARPCRNSEGPRRQRRTGLNSVTPANTRRGGEDDQATANRLLAPSCASAAIGRFPHATPRSLARHRRALASCSMRVLSWRLRSTEAA